MWYDSSTALTAGDDDDDDAKDEEEQIIETGDDNLGDDIGERVGHGHDTEAEPV